MLLVGAAFAVIVGTAAGSLALVMALLGGVAILGMLGWMFYRNLRQKDADAPVDATPEASRPRCSTLLIGARPEQRVEITARLAGVRDRALLAELVERYVLADDALGLVSLEHEPLFLGEETAEERVAVVLGELAHRDRSVGAAGSAAPLGASVLAIAFASRSGPMPRPRSRRELARQIAELAPLSSDAPLTFETQWVPVSEERAFDAESVGAAFPELERPPIDA